jgi:hypothetical protein
LPPIKKSCEFDSFNTVAYPKTKKKAVEVCLDGAPGHFQLFGNLGVVAALQQQFGNLLLPRSQAKILFPHARPSGRGKYASVPTQE